MTNITRHLCTMAAAFAAAALAVAPVHAETAKVRFLLDWAFQGQQSMFTVPVDDGTFQRLGLDAVVDRGVGSADTVTKVASGAYDMGVADLYAMVRFNDQNPSHRLIAVMMVNDKSALAVEFKSASSIKSPADLKGRKLAAPQGDASRQLFPLFARANHLDDGAIEWINVSPELREPMLIRDQVDAITGNIPTVLLNLRAINLPESYVRVMPYVDFGLELYGLALITTPAYAERNPTIVQNFIRGTVHGMNVMIKDPTAAVASVKKRDPLTNEEIEKARIKMTLDYAIITPNVLKNGLSNVDMARLGGTLKAVAEPLQLKAAPPASDVYTAQYLPPRNELGIAQ